MGAGQSIVLGVMRIYLTVCSIPELASLPETAREEVWQRCHTKAWRHWQTWVAFFICMALLGTGYWVSSLAFSADSTDWSYIVLGFLLVVLGSGGFFPIHVAMVRRYLIEELRK